MSWMVMIYGFLTEEEAEKARIECQIKFGKWADKQNEDEEKGAVR